MRGICVRLLIKVKHMDWFKPVMCKSKRLFELDSDSNSDLKYMKKGWIWIRIQVRRGGFGFEMP